jgi:hypothetical protein
MYSMPPSSLSKWLSPNSNYVEFSSTGGEYAGVVKLHAEIQTCPATGSDPNHSLYMMYCIAVLANFNTESLEEASKSLTDLYTWQIEKSRIVPRIVEQVPFHAKNTKTVERAPFIISEE